MSYLVVGTLATLMEWATYYLLEQTTPLHYLIITAIAFMFSTWGNWCFGRRLTFRNAPKQGTGRELRGIYLVSAAGLAFNLFLMIIFVQGLGWPEMPAKIAATGIVFFWNFLARKILIYKV